VAGSPADPELRPRKFSDAFARALRGARIVGVLRAPSPQLAVNAAQAAVRGGLRALEVTFTTPQAEQVIERVRREQPHLHLGAGTVMNRQQAQAAIDAGAQFLVSPHLGEDVLEVARAAGVEYLPGVLTPTEIARAQQLGVSTLKLFPVSAAGGTAYLRDLLGPFPHLQALVTGGVRPDEVLAYLGAGAVAVGLGSHLFPRRAFGSGVWAEVESATRAALLEAGLK